MNGFHLLAYEAALGVNAANTDIAAVTDPVINPRNSHFIFTDPFDLIWAAYFAVSATAARFNIPTINGIARHHLWPLERSATIPDRPGIIDMRDYPLRLPMNEEIAVEGSNNLGAATEASYAFLAVAPAGWNQNLPRGIQRIMVRATYAITTTANVWSPLGALTFAENLKGGHYAVNGMFVQDANVLASRLVFAKSTAYNGRNLRPGVLVQNAIGNRPDNMFRGGLGCFGYFHSFEPPQIEILANNAAAHTGEVRLDLTYMGDRATY